MADPTPTRRELAFPTTKMDRNHIPIFRSIQDYIRRNKTIGITAGLTTDQTGVVTATWTPIDFDDVYVQDHASFRDGVNDNRFFAPMVGWYGISVHASIDAASSINRRLLKIAFQSEGSPTDEALLAYSGFGGTGSDTHSRLISTITAFRYMLASEWVSFNVWQNSGFNKVVDAGDTGMSMVRLAL